MKPEEMSDAEYLGYRKAYCAELIKKYCKKLQFGTYSERIRILKLVNSDLRQVENNIEFYKSFFKDEKGEQTES